MQWVYFKKNIFISNKLYNCWLTCTLYIPQHVLDDDDDDDDDDDNNKNNNNSHPQGECRRKAAINAKTYRH